MGERLVLKLEILRTMCEIVLLLLYYIIYCISIYVIIISLAVSHVPNVIIGKHDTLNIYFIPPVNFGLHNM